VLEVIQILEWAKMGVQWELILALTLVTLVQ
jgi:hypothetical protein